MAERIVEDHGWWKLVVKDRPPGDTPFTQADVLELLPYVEEAAKALAFIRPDAVPWFTEACLANFDRSLFRGVRKRGSLIPKEQREILGLPRNAYLTYEAFNALTPLGRSMYEHALETTCLRIMRNYLRAEHARRRSVLFDVWRSRTIQTYRLWSLPDCCKDAKVMEGYPLAYADLPELPLKGCNHECCPCDYTLVDQMYPVSP